MKSKIILAVLALFAALIMTASACNVCPSGYETISGGFWDAGTSKTFTAPAAVSYQWYRVVESVPGAVDMGTTNPLTYKLVMPDNSWCGKEIAIYVTATNEFGCKWMKCIWYTIRCVVCPELNSFCVGKADDTDAGKFLPTLPSGVTATWTINGAALDTTSVTTIKTALNALTAATPSGTQYTAVMTLSSGQVCTKTFWVRPAPSGNLVVT
jgi:hypothetical protein